MTDEVKSALTLNASAVAVQFNEQTAMRGVDTGITFTLTPSNTRLTSANFTITGADGMVDERFAIVKSGSVWILRLIAGETIDFETENSPTIPLTISVSDGGMSPQTSEVNVSLNIIDINDEAPIITPSATDLMLVEQNILAEQDTDLGVTLTVTDADAGTDFTQEDFTLSDDRFLLSQGQDNGTWKLHLRKDQKVDYTTEPVIRLAITVSDGTNTSNTAELTFSVTGINSPPLFTSNSLVWEDGFESESVFLNGMVHYFYGEISADTTIGTILARISSSNSDGDNLSYTFANGDPAFAIDPTTGVLTRGDGDLKDSSKRYFLQIRVTDDGTPNKSDDIAVIIRVTEQLTPNAHAPIFSSDSIKWDATHTINNELPEDTIVSRIAGSTPVVRLTATDADEGATLTYRIIAGNEDGLFRIDADFGTVGLIGALDYETTTSYTLKIEASDGAKTATTDITIRVADVNEYAPVITANTTSINLAEMGLTSPQDIDTGITLMVSDADASAQFSAQDFVLSDDRFYVVPGDTVGHWAIQLRRQSKLDFTTEPVIALTVAVRDGDRISEEITIDFTITGSNHPPMFGDDSLVWESDFEAEDANVNGGVYHFFGSISDNTAVGTLLASLTASDADGDTLRYDFVDYNGDAFEIDPTSGAITRGSESLRLGTPYLLRVRVMDNGVPEKSDDIVVLLRVTSTSVTNNHAPVFSDIIEWEPLAMNGEIYEDTVPLTRLGTLLGTPLATLTATDADSTAGLIYTITAGNEDGLFAIDPLLGVIRLFGALDHEDVSEHRLTIQVSDGRNIDTTEVVIFVLDSNESPVFAQNAPVWEADFAQGQVSESTNPNTTLAKITATDPDANAKLTYHITAGNAAGLFAIDIATGVLSLVAPLDYESQQNQYTLTISASDGVNRTPIETTIMVVDENDETPNIMPSATEAPLDEQTTTDLVATDITFILNDADAGTSFTADDFTLSDQQRFTIADDNGVWRLYLKSGVTIDGLNEDTISLQVSVSDGVNTGTTPNPITLNVINTQDGDAELTIIGMSANGSDQDLNNAEIGWRLTANIATPDPDGVEGSYAFRWFYLRDADGSIGMDETYDISNSDRGEIIGVELTYTDGTGAKTQKMKTIPVEIPRYVVQLPNSGKGDDDITLPSDTASKVDADDGTDTIKDGKRNDIIIGGLGDDVIDLGRDSDGTDTDQVIYRIGDQTAADGGDRITNFNRGKDQFTFSLESNAETDKIENYEDFLNYVNSGTPGVVKDDQFLVLLDIDYFAPTLTLEGLYLHFKDSTFFSNGRIAMPLVNIKFAEGLTGDEFLKIFDENVDMSDVIDVNGLLRDLSYLDDLLGGEGSVSYEVV